MIKKICFFTDSYPSNDNPVYVFVGELVKAISANGIECSVITSRKKFLDARIQIDYDKNGNCIQVYRSFCPHLGLRVIGKKAATYHMRDWAFKRTFKKYIKDVDVVYAHFWHAGVPAANAIGDIPLFVASGESRVCVQELYARNIIDEAVNKVKGIICVATKNREESINLGLAELENTIVVPNAIDNKIFRKLDKAECRKMLSFPQDDFIIAFVGAFIDRKGPLRVAEAITRLGDDVKSIFIGKGEQSPNCDGVLFCGQLPHDEIPIYLNAADVFVLPTKQEGCCNAIVEAMACGLPIISTDRNFNDDILNNKNSIRIDCENIDEIASAIKKLKDSTELRYSMSLESLNIASELTIDKRASRIIRFMEDAISK